MKAVVYRRARTLTIEDRPEEEPGTGELRVLIDWQEHAR
jgi:hypothetical protein